MAYFPIVFEHENVAQNETNILFDIAWKGYYVNITADASCRRFPIRKIGVQLEFKGKKYFFMTPLLLLWMSNKVKFLNY